jgi:hypothetical protein
LALYNDSPPGNKKISTTSFTTIIDGPTGHFSYQPANWIELDCRMILDFLSSNNKMYLLSNFTHT